MLNIRQNDDGTMSLVNADGEECWRFHDDSVYSDYLVGGTAVATRGAAAPDFANLRDGLYLYAFDGAAAAEEVFFTVHILHDIKQGTTPTFHVHWTHNNASPSGDVKWQLEYTMAKGYETQAFGASTTLTSTQTASSQYYHHITPDDMSLDTTNMEPDSLILCRLYRDPTDAADTFADDAFLIQVDMHYERDKNGTKERNRPFEW